MKFNKNNTFKVYGDLEFRGKDISEDAVHIAFVAWVRYNHPEIAKGLFHLKNEGRRTPQQVVMDKKMGSILSGASDIMILGCPSLVLEIKIKDMNSAVWQPNQEQFLNDADANGSFACVAGGLDACKEAFNAWRIEVSNVDNWCDGIKYEE